LLHIKNSTMVNLAKEQLSNKSEYLFNIEIIDTKTEKLFSIINSVIRIIEFQKCKEEIHNIFFSLVHFADHNLKDLEIILKDLKCKTYMPQINHNKDFVENIIKLQNNYKEGKDNLCKNLLEFIIKWNNEQKEIDIQSIIVLEKNKIF